MSDKEEGSLPDSDASPVRGSPKSRSRSPSPVTRSRSRSLSASRSRSRSPRRRHKRSRSRSRGHRYSRSRSRSPYQRRRHRDSHGGERSSGRRRHRSHSRSPMSSRRRHQGNRDDPEPTRCLGVFGLSLHTQERDLREVFDRYGSVEEVQVVYDRQSGRSRGFSFVYFKSVNDAIEANPQPEGRERGNEEVVVVEEEEGEEEEETDTREVNAVKEAIAVTDMTEMDRTVMEAVLMDTASTTLMTDTIAIDHLLHIGEDRLPLTTVAGDHDPGPDLGPTPLHVAIKES